jgi:hypothetical protein
MSIGANGGRIERNVINGLDGFGIAT